MARPRPVCGADGRGRRIGRRRRGFTLLEVLASILFIAITLPAATHAVLTANRLGALAVRTRAAIQLGDGMLNQLIVTGEWQEGLTRGDFGDEWPDITWELYVEPWTEDMFVPMTRLTMEVTFFSQGREHVAVLDTLVYEE